MKIMFVCTGNICRSAMAEAIMKKRALENNLKIEVYSCGTYAENGQMASFNAIETMKQYDIDLNNHMSTNINNSNILDMDLILCTTFSHKANVFHLYPELKGKIFTIKEYADLLGNDRNYDIKDPWGYNMETYMNCAEEISLCIGKILEKIAK